MGCRRFQETCVQLGRFGNGFGAQAPADVRMTPERAQPRARGVDEHAIESALAHQGVQVGGVADDGLAHVRPVLLGALLEQLGLEGVHVNGDVLGDLLAVSPVGDALVEDGLRGAAGADLQERLRCRISHHQIRHCLGGGVGHEKQALVYHAAHTAIEQGHARRHFVAAGYGTAAQRHGFRPSVSRCENRDDLLVGGGLQRVDGDVDRSRLVRGYHEVAGALGPELCDEPLGEPHRETVQPRIGGDISARVAEGEDLFGAHHAAQHRIGETARARRHRLHQLDALIDGGMGALLQKDDLVGRQAQRVAHCRGRIVGRVHAARDDVLQGAARADHAQHEPGGEGPILPRQGRDIDGLGDDVLGERVALPQLVDGRQGKLAGRRGLVGLLPAHLVAARRASAAAVARPIEARAAILRDVLVGGRHELAVDEHLARVARLAGIAPRAAVCARAEILAGGAPTSWLAIAGTEVLPVGVGSLLVTRAPVVLAESAGLAVLAVAAGLPVAGAAIILAEATRLPVFAEPAGLAPFAEVARLPVTRPPVILAVATRLAVFAEPTGLASLAEVAGLAAGARPAVLPRAALGVAIALARSVVGSSLVVGSMIVMHGTMFLPRPTARGRRRQTSARPWRACRPVLLRLLPRPPRRSREAVGSR